MSGKQTRTIPRHLYGKDKFLTKYLTAQEQDDWQRYAAARGVIEMDSLLALARMRERNFKRMLKDVKLAHRD